jgi:uncharacterized delta-60 repeat protein
MNIILARPDGKMLVGGRYNTGYSGSQVNHILQLNSDGTRDTTFNVGTGSAAGMNSIGYVYAGVLQSDGSAILGGNFGSYSGSSVGYLVKLNTDGTINNTYSASIKPAFNSNVTSLALEASNQKLVAVGAFSTFSGSAATRIVRLNSDGTMDTTFNTGAGFNGNPTSVVVQPDGKVLVGGNFSTYSGSTANRIVRLTASGTIDPTFPTASGANNIVYSVASSGSNGRIVIGGTLTTYSGSTVNYFAVLTSSGSIDSTFNVGTGFDNQVRAVAIQPDNKILAIGTFQNYSGSPALGVARMNPDGTLDNTLNIPRGFNAGTSGANITVSGSNLYFPSVRSPYVPYMGVVDSSGTPTTTYYNTPRSAFNGNVYTSLKIANSSSILVAGNFTAYTTASVSRSVLLKLDGTIDTSFHSGTGSGAGFNAAVWSLAQQTDGKILATGDFTSYSGSAVNRIVRLNLNGTIDTTFNVGTGLDSTGQVIKQLANGQVAVGGSFSTYNGTTRLRLVRINSNGTIDTGFSVGTGLDNICYAIEEQSDSSLIVAGAFTTYNGATANRIARINTNGALNGTFTGTANNTIYALKTLTTGYTLVGGTFTSFNSNTSASMIVKITGSTGAFDPTFATSSIVNNPDVRAIAALTNGQIMVGGNFNYYSSTYVSASTTMSISPYLMRLNANGTPDLSFSCPGIATYTITPFTA